MKTIDERIASIEALVGNSVAGTVLMRSMKSDGPGLEWSLGLGGISMPKEFFYGETIDSVLTLAENTIQARLDEAKRPTKPENEKLSEVLGF